MVDLGGFDVRRWGTLGEQCQRSALFLPNARKKKGPHRRELPHHTDGHRGGSAAGELRQHGQALPTRESSAARTILENHHQSRASLRTAQFRRRPCRRPPRVHTLPGRRTSRLLSCLARQCAMHASPGIWQPVPSCQDASTGPACVLDWAHAGCLRHTPEDQPRLRAASRSSNAAVSEGFGRCFLGRADKAKRKRGGLCGANGHR